MFLHNVEIKIELGKLCAVHFLESNDNYTPAHLTGKNYYSEKFKNTCRKYRTRCS